jgi:LacI family transcriptional regulator, repressor for deo operon, udp, cdd, tsx, nupC, and nupG
MTIKAIAAAIGVSPSTVSRAMSGKGRLSAATRRKVLQRIEEAGYAPNLHARRLVTGRSHMVALDYGGSPHALADLYLIELTRGLQESLEACSYALLLNGDRHALRRWVRSRAVDGVILLGDACGEQAAQLAADGAACVVIGACPVTGVTGIPGVACVVEELRTGARSVARHLTGQGHRRIAYVGTRYPDVVLTAFRDELEALGFPLDDDLLLIPGRTPEAGANAVAELLARTPPPTALFARTDALAIGALRQAQRLGARVPEDLSVVGHDDVTFAELTDPPLTTVRIDCAQVGQAAAESLLALLHRTGEPVPARTVETELVVRQSMAPPATTGDRHPLSRLLLDRKPARAAHGRRELCSS